MTRIATTTTTNPDGTGRTVQYDADVADARLPAVVTAMQGLRAFLDNRYHGLHGDGSRAKVRAAWNEATAARQAAEEGNLQAAYLHARRVHNAYSGGQSCFANPPELGAATEVVRLAWKDAVQAATDAAEAARPEPTRFLLAEGEAMVVRLVDGHLVAEIHHRNPEVLAGLPDGVLSAPRDTDLRIGAR